VLRFRVVVLVAAAWTCETKPVVRLPQAPAPSTPAPEVRTEGSEAADSDSLAERTVLFPELDDWLSRLAKGVDTNVTLGKWLADHPGDSVSRTLSMPEISRGEAFCRSASAPIIAGPRVWKRSALFVIPSPPAGESLPDTSRLAERLCRIRALWLKTTDPDSLVVKRQTAALRGRLSGTLGDAQPQVLISGLGVTWSGFGDTWWNEGASWVSGRRVVVLGIEPRDSSREYLQEAAVVRPPAVSALSYVIGRGLDTATSPLSAVSTQKVGPKVAPERIVEMARADSALGRSGLSGLLPLRRLFAHYLDSTGFEKDPSASVDSVLLQALAALRDTSTLPPRQRSAAFLAADIAVHVHADELYFEGYQGELRRAVQQAGATYDYDEANASWIYARPWLWRAYQLDSLGPAGKSAFAELMREGWATGSGCPGGPNVTGEVISRGERALGAGLIDPMVHLYVAQAYADLFSRSERAQDSVYDQTTVSATDGEMARRRALEHYRQALAGIRDLGFRQTMWDKAVHLMLRLPIQTRYFCYYD
jgi:hypothetical protein